MPRRRPSRPSAPLSDAVELLTDLDLSEAGFLQAELAEAGIASAVRDGEPDRAALWVARDQLERARELTEHDGAAEPRQEIPSALQMLSRSKRWGAAALTFLMTLRYGVRLLGHPVQGLLVAAALSSLCLVWMEDGG